MAYLTTEEEEEKQPQQAVHVGTGQGQGAEEFDPDAFMKGRTAATPAGGEFDPDAFMQGRSGRNPPLIPYKPGQVPGATPKLLEAINAGEAPDPYKITPKTEFERKRTEGERGFGIAAERGMPGLFEPGYKRAIDPTTGKPVSIWQGTADIANRISPLPGTPGFNAPPAEDKSLGLFGRAALGWKSATDPRAQLTGALAYSLGPFVGYDPEAAERKAERADPGGILGQAVAPVLQTAGPMVVGETVSAINRRTAPPVAPGMSPQARAKMEHAISRRGAEDIFRAGGATG